MKKEMKLLFGTLAVGGLVGGFIFSSAALNNNTSMDSIDNGKVVVNQTMPFFSKDSKYIESDKVLIATADDRVEKAVQWAIDIANDPSHGYSQGAENATANCPYTGSRESPDYDCSSLVYHAFNYAGFNIIYNWQYKNPEYMARYNGEQYSGDADTIWTDLSIDGGWQKFSWNEIKNNLKRGDILCIPEQHVAIYIGNGQTVEARGVNNPRGGDWRTGDQGGEIDIYEAQGRGWLEVYRYIGSEVQNS